MIFTSLLLSVLLAQSANYRLGDQLYLEWDAQAPDIFFYVQVDEGSWVTTSTMNVYAIPMQELGDHIIRVKACNVDECTESVDLQFKIVPRTRPNKPTNVFIRTRPPGLS